MRVLLTILALALATAPASAQVVCNGNSCRQVQPAAVKWINSNEFAEGDKTFARGADGVFREKVAAKKIITPKVKATVYEGPLPTGVARDKLASEERYSVNGKTVERSAVVQSLAGDKKAPDALVDDSAEVSVSVFAPTIDEARKTKEELRGQLGDAGFRYWHGTANDWSGKPVGFKTDGQPTVYCQAPTGKVLHRQDDYDGGALAAVGAIRKAKADYDLAKDPDRRKADAAPSLPGSSFNWIAALALAGLFFVLTTRKPATN